MATRRSGSGRLSPRFALVTLLATAATAGTVLGARAARRRRIRRAEEASRPADVGFMWAMHNAFRRDLARLEQLARDASTGPPAGQDVQRAWDSFRDRLHRHHAAEDDDLWPVLRDHLTTPADVASVDQMVEEHHALSAAMDAVDQVVAAPPAAGTGGHLTAAVDRLSRTARDHLDHEERDVLPLVENHLSRADWRAFLLTERRKTPLRARPDFLGWVLDEASPDDARAVLAELPPPGRLAYRYVIGPRYRSRARPSTRHDRSPGAVDAHD
jgi:hemerythrin-like domain-containing protein